MLQATFVLAALDAGVPWRDVERGARSARRPERATRIYDRRRPDFNRRAAPVVVAIVVGG